MPAHAIKAVNLTKIFYSKERRGWFKRGRTKKIVAVDHISFKVRYGEIFGFLGPNGAGKTTTIKMLTTLLIPDEGDAWVCGYHVVNEANRVREVIGLSLYSDRGFYWKLTGRENLRYFAYLYHIPPKQAEKRIDELLKLVGLQDKADVLVEEYSTGMKSKLNFARALLNDPEVVFLDEPTIGLDPNSARAIREIILDLKKQGKTIFLTTHNMEEADYLCDRIAIISRGKIIATGTSSELKSLIERRDIIVVEASNISDKVIEKIKGVDGVAYVSKTIKDPVSMSGVLRIGLNGNSRDLLPSILRVLVNSHIKVNFIKPSEPTLEDVFIKLTGRGFYEEEVNSQRATK